MENQSEFFDIQKLNDPKVYKELQTNILDEIKKDYQWFYIINDDIDILWSGLKSVIHSLWIMTYMKISWEMTFKIFFSIDN